MHTTRASHIGITANVSGREDVDHSLVERGSGEGRDVDALPSWVESDAHDQDDDQVESSPVTRERIWKLVSAGIGMLGGLLARKLMRVGYQAIRKDAAAPSPFDPTSARFSWLDAVLWAAAAGIGLGITKVLSARVAAMGWEAATGTLPPGFVEEPVVT